MNPMEEGKLFTDRCYATKSMVEAHYHLNDVSRNWENVLNYRKAFDVSLDYHDNDGNNYKICLTKGITRQGYVLELALMKDLVLFAKLSSQAQNQFLLERKMKAIQGILLFSGRQNINQETLRKLSLGEMESITPALFVADSYSKAYNRHYLNDSIDVEAFNDINRALLNANNGEAIYRQEEPSDLKNTLKAPSVDQIPAKLAEVRAFLSQDDIPDIFKAIAILYLYHVIRPYDAFYEASAALLSKNYLRVSGYETMGFVLDFESIAFANGQDFFRQLSLSESTLDLTYFINYTLPYLVQDEENIHQSLKDAFARDVQETKPVSSAETNHGTDVAVFTPTNDKALPVFPVSKSPDEVDQMTKKLLEVYPQLKPKEAHFYAGHCTIGLNYTIEMFRKEEATVYETARTNMDDLANRGFYRKNKIQKKFVYTPIPLNSLNDPNGEDARKSEE